MNHVPAKLSQKLEDKPSTSLPYEQGERIHTLRGDVETFQSHVSEGDGTGRRTHPVGFGYGNVGGVGELNVAAASVNP